MSTSSQFSSTGGGVVAGYDENGSFWVFFSPCIVGAEQHGVLLITSDTEVHNYTAGKIRGGGSTVSSSYQDWREDPRPQAPIGGHNILQPGDLTGEAGNNRVFWRIVDCCVVQVKCFREMVKSPLRPQVPYFQQGKHTEAEPFHSRRQESVKKYLDPPNPDVPTILSNPRRVLESHSVEYFLLCC